MKIKIILLMLILFVSTIFADTNNYVKIAVLDFTMRTQIDKIDKQFLADRLQIELVNIEGIKVVERFQLKKIIDEQKLQLSGLTEKEAVKIGGLSGADKIVVGSISQVDNSYIVIIKLIDTSTAEINFIDQISGESTIELSESIRGVAKKIAKTLLKKDNIVMKEDITYKEDKTYRKQSKDDKKYIEIPNSKKFWIPIAISFVTPIQLPSEDYSIYGGVFSFISAKYSRVYGISFSYIINEVDKMYGIQYSLLSYNNELYGMQYGLINFSYQKAFGIQFGLFNKTEVITGVQVGIINIAHRMVGIQVGLVNLIDTGFVPVMVGINMSF